MLISENLLKDILVYSLQCILAIYSKQLYIVHHIGVLAVFNFAIESFVVLFYTLLTIKQ